MRAQPGPLRRAVRDRPVLKDGDVGGVAADVGEHDAELAVLVAERRLGGGELREHRLLDLDAGALDALHKVL